MDTPVKLGCGLVLLSSWDARRREVRERPRQGSGPMSEPTTIKVKDGGFVSVERGRASADVVVGNRPLAERTVAGTGALRRNGDFVRRKRTNVGAAGVLGLFASGVSTSSPPLAAPPPVVPCSSPRRFREARWTEGRERGSSCTPVGR